MHDNLSNIYHHTIVARHQLIVVRYKLLKPRTCNAKLIDPLDLSCKKYTIGIDSIDWKLTFN